MTTPEINVVLRYFARCAEGNPAIVDMYTDDAEFFDCAGPTTFTGRDSIRHNVFEPIFTAFPDFRCHDQVRHIMSNDGVVMAELVISGTHRGEFLDCPPTQRPVSWNTTGVWEITTDGLIRREAYYWDIDTVRQQLLTAGS